MQAGTIVGNLASAIGITIEDAALVADLKAGSEEAFAILIGTMCTSLITRFTVISLHSLYFSGSVRRLLARRETVRQSSPIVYGGRLFWKTASIAKLVK